MTTSSDKKRVRLFVLNDPSQLRISTALAMEIGFNESIVLLQLEYLISISTTQEIDGALWMFESIPDMRAKWFPFWSVTKIWRVLQSLSKKGLVNIDNFNKSGFDRTSWFSLNEAGISLLKSVRLDTTIFQNEKSRRSNRKMDTTKTKNGFINLQNPSTQNEMTIPKIPTKNPSEISTENSSSSNCNQAAPKKEEEVSNKILENLNSKFLKELRAIGVFEKLLPEVAMAVAGGISEDALCDLMDEVEKIEPNPPATAALFMWRLRNRPPGQVITKSDQEFIRRRSYVSGEFANLIQH